MSVLGDVVRLFRTVDRLLALEAKHGEVLQKLRADLDDMQDRLTRLEVGQGLVVAEAKGAAAAAATVAVTGNMMDLARRVGALEAWGEHGGLPALPPG